MRLAAIEAGLTPAATDPPGTAAGALAVATRADAGVEQATNLKNMRQLIQLRWIAVIGQMLTIGLVHLGWGIALPVVPMFTLLAGQAAFNLFSQYLCNRRTGLSNTALLIALLVDVDILGGLLYLSGGATNPFAFLFLLQVILAAVLLKPWSTWLVLTITCASFALLTHFHLPLPMASSHAGGLSNPFIQGVLFCFAASGALLVVFITRINHILRERDALLADLHQRASEEEHIVRMGLLASGAAHELGTPLATMSVILGDWRRMPALAGEPELRQEIDEMQAQLNRCKNILTDILTSAGEARGESPVQTTLHRFLDGLVDDWQCGRPQARLAYERHIDHDLPIVSDSALRQMICNVLDNAFDASPGWVSLDAHQANGRLILDVRDRGGGFAPGMLARFGKPYQSTKGRPGGGLGLFLALNVARALGGTITAGNRSAGGAIVTLTLPLDAITLQTAPNDETENERSGRKPGSAHGH